MTSILEDIHRAQQKRANTVGLLLIAGLLIGFVLVLGRVVQLQVAPSAALAEHIDDRSARFTALARRGDIFDRRGRIVAGTRTGFRLFVDPARLVPEEETGRFDELIVQLADIAGIETVEVAERVLGRVMENERRATTATEGQEPRLIRYVSVGEVLEDTALMRARDLVRATPGVHLEEITTREQTDHALLAALVGKVGTDGLGKSGAELAYNDNLGALPGYVEPVLDARGRSLWVPPSGYTPSQAGGEVRLSVDLEIQRIVHEELTRRVEELDAAGAKCVMVDPETGEVLAIVDVVRELADAVVAGSEEHRAAIDDGREVRVRTMTPDPLRETEPALARIRCAVDVYEPGSTFKPFVWAMVLERGRTEIDEVFDTHKGRWRTDYGRLLEDVAPRDEQSWSDVLVNSSNIGMAKGAHRLSPVEMRSDILRWGFGSPTRLGIPGEAKGLVTSQPNWTKLSQSSVAMGYEVAVTPLQMVRSFSAFARSGNRAGEVPALTLESLTNNDPRLGITQRILRPSTADAARVSMAGVTEKLIDRVPAWIEGEAPFPYTAFGKSGTAKTNSPLGGYLERQYTTSFIAGAPFENPRIVLVVVIDDPGPEVVQKGHYYGSMTAGPALLRIARRTLEYLGVPHDAETADF